ncbi:hypothetical protein BB561_004768 [Smittium simulii]|uniref:Uncharacterized protein n=1 Tax=Smittium simulii TaxID=133385 RepID=A0A2T9YEC0_9FUNG|nr:hypothetical protein BB561_004768 [Smittium simulii]
MELVCRNATYLNCGSIDGIFFRVIGTSTECDECKANKYIQICANVSSFFSCYYLNGSLAISGDGFLGPNTNSVKNSDLLFEVVL